MIKKTLVSIMIIVLCALTPAQAMAQPMPQPVVSAEAAILLDSQNGQILYQKNTRQRMYPASTTKILTALIAIKKGNLGDRVLISHEAASTDGSAVGLQEGEYVKLEDLLYAMMLSSANDASVAIAEHIGGSLEGFSQMMNDEARSLGAVNSHFVTPHGLHDPSHYTTAGDLAIIAREAMKNSVFRKYVSTYSHHIERTLPRPVNGIPQEDYVNHNKLLWARSIFGYPGAIGIKTGYTDEARQCLVSSAKRGGRELLAVVLKTENNGMYKDSIALLDYGFEGFKQVPFVEEGFEAGQVKVLKGEEEEVGAVAAADYYYNAPLNQSGSVEKKIQLDANVEAPVVKGQKIGVMTFLMNGNKIGQVDLVADRNLERGSLFRWWYGAVVMGFLLVYSRAQARAKRRRYYEYRRKRYY